MLILMAFLSKTGSVCAARTRLIPEEPVPTLIPASDPQAEGDRILLNRQEIRLSGKGRYIREQRVVTQVQSTALAHQFRRLTYLFDSSEETVDVIRVVVRNRNGQLFVAKDSHIHSERAILRKGSDLYGALRKLIVRLKTEDPPFVVDAHIRRRGAITPRWKKIHPFFETFLFGGNLRVKHQVVRIHAPDSYPLQVQTLGSAVVAHEPGVVTGERVISFEMDDLNPWSTEEAQSPARSFADGVRISSFASWDEVAGWISAAFKPVSRSGKRLMKKSFSQPALPSSLNLPVTGAALRSIQLIDLEFPRCRYLPHNPSGVGGVEVGDLWDKAGVLYSLAIAETGQGIPALAIRNGTVFDRSFVTPDEFDSIVIVVSGRQAGHISMIDPQCRYCPIGEGVSDLSGSPLLLATGQGAEWQTMAIQQPTENTVNSTYRMRIDGLSVRLWVQSETTGFFARNIWNQIEDRDSSARRKLVWDELNRWKRGLQILSFALPDHFTLTQPLVCSSELFLRKSGSKQNGEILFRFVDNPFSFLRFPLPISSRSRKTPVHIPAPCTITDIYQLGLPPNLIMANPPPDLHRENEFAALNCSFSKKMARLEYRIERTVKRSIFSPDDYAQCMTVFSPLFAEESGGFLLREKYSTEDSAGMNRNVPGD